MLGLDASLLDPDYLRAKVPLGPTPWGPRSSGQAQLGRGWEVSWGGPQPGALKQLLGYTL